MTIPIQYLFTILEHLFALPKLDTMKFGFKLLAGGKKFNT